jgi:hypothetical protein
MTHETHSTAGDGEQLPDFASMETQEILGQYSYSGYDQATDTLRFMSTQTFREGVVRFGGDKEQKAGEVTVPMNAEQMLVVPTGDSATVLRAERVTKRGRPQTVLYQYRVNGVFDAEPEVTVEAPQPLKQNMSVPIDVGRFGYVKAVRRPQPDFMFADPQLQEVVETRGLSEEERRELTLVHNSLNAIGLLPQERSQVA